MKIKFMSVMLILVVVLIACSSGSDKSGNEAFKDVDDKKIVKKIFAEIEVLPFDEAVSEAELIAEVQIKNLVKEIDEPSEKTIFKVELLDVLRGNVNKKSIKILQQGTKEVSFNDNEMFKEGEKYVLFLKETIEFPEADYWIQGEEWGIYKVIDDKIVKINGPYEELKDIQIGEKMDNVEIGTNKVNSEQQLINDEIQQILDKESFFKLIKTNAKDGEE